MFIGWRSPVPSGVFLLLSLLLPLPLGELGPFHPKELTSPRGGLDWVSRCGLSQGEQGLSLG